MQHGGLDARSRRSSRNLDPSPLTPWLSPGGAMNESLSLAQLGVTGLSSQVDRVAQQRGGHALDLELGGGDEQEHSSHDELALVSVAEARRRAGLTANGGVRSDPVPPQPWKGSACMVDAWLGPKGLAQYAERIVFAFKEAEYRPHEWTHTLDSMGPDELREFIAAVEKSPAPNE